MRRPIAGFRRVGSTLDERNEYAARHGRAPAVGRVECLGCGARIWGSGIGIGSHRRACFAARSAWQDDGS